MSSAVLDELRPFFADDEAHFVGGCVRDLRLGRPVVDVDVVVPGDPAPAARRLARATGGAPFALSEAHGAWRVVLDGRTIDVTARRGGDIVADLGERDFTVNAMAIPVAGAAEDVVDPYGGLSDLADRRMRVVSERVFADDPLRLLRLARIAHELGFEVDPGAARLARRDAHLADRAAGERIYAELRRLLAPEHPDAGVRLLDGLGVLDVVLPEAGPMRGCEQSPFHHLDVFEHTLQVLDAAADISAHPDHYLPRHAERLRRAMDETVGDDLDARTALRFAALFHDIEKPSTRAVSADGRVGFMGHDKKGAETTRRILKRWRAATSTIRFCMLLVAEHLRLGFMVHDRPLGRRDAYRYLRATEPYVEASVVISLADRFATRGVRARQAYVRAHAETADELLSLVADLEAEEREPLLRGDEIAELTGSEGPRIGQLVDALAEEQAAGAVTTREEAVAFVRG
jgi:putative nucleotidyltransferase with HDIG domain